MSRATEQALAEIRKIGERMDAIDKAMAEWRKPATKAALAPEQVVSLLSGGRNVVVGTDGGAMPLRVQFDPRKRGVGIGPACKMIADIALGRGGSADQLERDHGFVTLEKYKTDGIKMPDGTIRKAALAEGSGVTGGYVVPPQFSSQLLRLSLEQSVVRTRATVLPMSSRSLMIPYLDVTTAQSAGKTAFLGGIAATWQPESADIKETEPQFRQMELVAYDLVFHTVASNQLLADNAIVLDALLTQLFSEAIAWYTEYAFLRGTGAGDSMPLGVLNAPATIAVSRSSANTFKLADVANMISRLLVSSWDNAVWIMHQSVLPQLIQMTDAGNRLVWINPAPPTAEGGVANRLPVTLLGLPVYFSEKVPALGTKGDVMLCDFSKYVIGDRMDLQIDVSPHVKFLNNQMVWRVVARLDGRPWLNAPVTLADGSKTVSPFVVLN
jgi:HK97 family phage major capsid protein